MTKREELELFLAKADELIDSKYILADVRIANLLKSIANSKTMVAVFKNCLNEFDYEGAKRKYLVKSKFLSSDKGEFIAPTNSGDLLAFVFCVLMDIDGKVIELGDFLNKYFYEDGSFSSSYVAWTERMIKPFSHALKTIMEGVLCGEVQDPEEAFSEELVRKQQQAEKLKAQEKEDLELSKKAYGESVKAIKEILLNDKTRLKKMRLNNAKKEEITLAIDMLANVLTSMEKDAINYGFLCYKYIMKAYPIRFFKRVKRVQKQIKVVLNGI